MRFLEHQLEVKESTVPSAGKGLFTTQPIAKGSIILEYTGTITTWKDISKTGGHNCYLFYVTRNRVIDASGHPDVLGRYVNDARGLTRIKGFRNNARFVNEKGKIYLEAAYNIPAGKEIMAHYGSEFWESIQQNQGGQSTTVAEEAVAV